MKDRIQRTIEPFYQGLMCAGLHRGLRSILLLDSGFEELHGIVPLFQEILEIGAQSRVETVTLPAMPFDDDLWGNFMPKPNASEDKTEGKTELAVAWREGMLTRNRLEKHHLLVVIPDLARINQAVSRACIMFMDSPAACLQRHGQDHVWNPEITWLAACDRDRIGRVSNHLLDRFVLRLSAPPFKTGGNVSDIREWANGGDDSSSLTRRTTNVALSNHIKDQMTRAVQHPISIESNAMDRVLGFFPEESSPGIRRELALVRMGLALARLESSPSVTAAHIRKAAGIIGLPDILAVQEEQAEKTEPKTEKIELPKPDTPDISPEPETATNTDFEPINDEIHTHDPEPPAEPETLPPSVMMDMSPYPEDTAPVEREQYSLQLPIRRLSPSSDGRGVILGDQPAHTLSDLAIVPTIVEATMFQTIRRINDESLSKDRLIISPADLRSYRREPKPDKMLILVIDYTCLRDCKWQDKLLPHLRWAYVSRASVCIIQVGAAADENEELRAKKITAKNVLSRAIEDSLEAEPGKATPLAHGLDLAYHTIQQTQLHGREHIFNTRLVVITDGRGNVPLNVSLEGKEKRPVNREGIDDALEIAHKMYHLKRLRIVLLDPQPRYHPELPVMLADAMGAVRELIDLYDDF